MRLPVTRILAATVVVTSALAFSGCYASPEERAASEQRAALLSAEIADLGLHLVGDRDEITGYDTEGFRTVLRFRELGKLLCYVDDEHAHSTTVDPQHPPTLMCAPFKKKTTTQPDAIIIVRTVTKRVPAAPFRTIGDIAADTSAVLPAT